MEEPEGSMIATIIAFVVGVAAGLLGGYILGVAQVGRIEEFEK